MVKKNIFGEKYLDISPELYTKLDKICETLESNLRTKGKNYTVMEIVSNTTESFTKSFNDLWELPPNNLDNKHSKKEFRGVYAFAAVDENKIDFEYVGISRTIRRRFSQHSKRSNKGNATWAYLMAEQDEKKIEEYQKKFIYPLHFTFCPLVDDNMFLHIAEVYCVNKLKARWNTFKTH